MLRLEGPGPSVTGAAQQSGQPPPAPRKEQEQVPVLHLQDVSDDPRRGGNYYGSGPSETALGSAFGTFLPDTTSDNLAALLGALHKAEAELKQYRNVHGLQNGDQVLLQEDNGALLPATVVDYHGNDEYSVKVELEQTRRAALHRLRLVG